MDEKKGLAFLLARTVCAKMDEKHMSVDALALRLSNPPYDSFRSCRKAVIAIRDAYLPGYSPKKSGGVRSRRLSALLHILQVPEQDPVIEKLRSVYPDFTYQ